MTLGKKELESLLTPISDRLTINDPIMKWTNERNIPNLKAVLPVVFDESMKEAKNKKGELRDVLRVRKQMKRFNNANVGCVAIQ